MCRVLAERFQALSLFILHKHPLRGVQFQLKQLRAGRRYALTSAFYRDPVVSQRLSKMTDTARTSSGPESTH